MKKWSFPSMQILTSEKLMLSISTHAYSGICERKFIR